MPSPDADLQRWLRDRPMKVRRRLAAKIREQADRVADAIKQAAPQGVTGDLKASVQVRRRRGDLSLEVTAGGEATTKPVREGSGVDYDYAMAQEFGTERQAAQPFFYPTWNAMRDDVQNEIANAAAEAMND